MYALTDIKIHSAQLEISTWKCKQYACAKSRDKSPIFNLENLLYMVWYYNDKNVDTIVAYNNNYKEIVYHIIHLI